MKLSGRDFRRILLVKPSSLGDIIHALPVLHALRQRYPDAKIDWLVGAGFAPILADHPDLNEVILFDRNRLGRLARSLDGARALLSMVRELRRRRYDLAIDLQGLFRSGFLTRATGASVRLGFRSAREGAWLFYSHRTRDDAPNAHAVDRYMGVGKWLGLAEAPARFNLAVPPAAEVEMSAALASVGIGGSDRVVIVVPGARWETKRWGANRFAAAIDAIQDETGLRCILVGGPGRNGVVQPDSSVEPVALRKPMWHDQPTSVVGADSACGLCPLPRFSSRSYSCGVRPTAGLPDWSDPRWPHRSVRETARRCQPELGLFSMLSSQTEPMSARACVHARSAHCIGCKCGF